MSKITLKQLLMSGNYFILNKQNLKLVSQKNSGIPRRRYFKINFENLKDSIPLDISSKKPVKSSSQKNRQLEVKKFNDLKLKNSLTGSQNNQQHINNVDIDSSIDNIDILLKENYCPDAGIEDENEYGF